MALLAMAPGDAHIMVAALERANQQRRDYDDAFAAAIGGRVAAAVVPPLTKSLGALVKSLANAMSSSR